MRRIADHDGDSLVVNARFRSQPGGTGVAQWASELLAALSTQGIRPVEVTPRRGSGAAGHAWEQLVLPRRYAAQRSALPLLSPCNWGPVAVRRQALVIHDVAPLLIPEYFRVPYVALVRLQLRALARRVEGILTVSESSRADIVAHLNVAEDKVHVVGMGTRTLPAPDPDAAGALPESYFAFIGAHDARKNLAFLLDLWPRVYACTGAHLVVTRRPVVRTNIGSQTTRQPWFHELVSPSDTVLAAVLANSAGLLWPSVYEGFGMPLLEAYQLGTGFVSSDTGAARELALPCDAVLPLEADAWEAAIVERAGEGADHTSSGERRAVAARYRWEDVAERLVKAVRA